MSSPDKSHNVKAVLADLAAKISDERDASLKAFRKGTDHAIKTGEYLYEAKLVCDANRIPWMQWVKENCQFSHDTAEDYRLLYRKTKDDLKLKEHVLQLGIAAAKKYLRGLDRPAGDDEPDTGNNDDKSDNDDDDTGDDDSGDGDRGGRSDSSERRKAIEISERNRTAWLNLYDHFDQLLNEMGEAAFHKYVREELAPTESVLIEEFIVAGPEIPIPQIYRDLIQQSPERHDSD
jgi:hypothetical protein